MTSISSEHSKLIKSATYLSVTTVSLILIAKIYGWLVTSSVSMLASLIDSTLDITASIINLIAVRYALLPPDDNHRFGHDKIQDLAVFAQSIFFFALSIFIIFTSINHFFSYENINDSTGGIKVMVFSIICTAILVSYQTYVLSKTDSSIIVADKLHYIVDLLSNCAVIISLYFSKKYWYIDSICGFFIAGYLIYGSYQIFRKAVRNLVDEEFTPEQKEKLLAILSTHKKNGNIFAVHELKTRTAGNKDFIQLHIELDGHKTLYQIHEISDIIMADIMQQFPNAEVLIHQDPVGIEAHENYQEELNVQ